MNTYKLTQTGPETQDILDEVNVLREDVDTNTIDIEQLQELYQAFINGGVVIIKPTDTWPVANPTRTAIYRVIDRENTPPEYYADYMWNGTSFEKMAQYDNNIDDEPTADSDNLVKSGGVVSYVATNGSAFDISVANASGGVSAKYADLADALGTNGANVPSAVRKGGMSVKFIQQTPASYSVVVTTGAAEAPTGGVLLDADPEITSGSHTASDLTALSTESALPTSVGGTKTYYFAVTGDTTTYTTLVVTLVQNFDHKYVQWRLMKNTWSTTEKDWQGVDDEPKWDDNLIKSKAVLEIEKGLSLLTGEKEILDKDDYENISIQYILSNGEIGGNSNYRLRKYSSDGVVALKIQVALSDNAPYAIGFYSDLSFSASTFISGVARTGQNMEYIVENIPSGCKYIAIVNRESDYTPIIEIVSYPDGNAIKERLSEVENETQEIQQRLDEIGTEGVIYTSITGTNQNNGGNSYYIYNTGTIATDSNLFRATLFEIETGKQYCATANILYSSTALAVFFDAQMNYIGYQGRGNLSTEDHYEKELLVIPANTKYVGLTNKRSDSQTYPLLYKKETKILILSGNVIFSDDKTLEEKANDHFSLLSNKRWACVGDSLTALGYTDKHYYDYVAEVTGIIPLNYGVGGTGYAKGDNPFYSRISSIPLNVDVITIFGSGNDLSSGKAIGNIDDTGTTTICGCINQTLDNIFDRFPITPLAIVTPTPWKNTDMEDYVNAIVSICKKRGVPVCDLYHCSNMHPDSLTYRELVYSGDETGGDGTPKGVHPNAIGHKIMAPHFLQTLESVVI